MIVIVIVIVIIVIIGNLIELLWLNKNLSRTSIYWYTREQQGVRFRRVRDFKQRTISTVFRQPLNYTRPHFRTAASRSVSSFSTSRRMPGYVRYPRGYLSTEYGFLQKSTGANGIQWFSTNTNRNIVCSYRNL